MPRSITTASLVEQAKQDLLAPPTRNIAKQCTKCGNEKPLSDYNRARLGKHGRAAQCKACFKEYRTVNAEYLHARSAANYQANREEVREAHADYYARNRDRVRAQQKENRHVAWEHEYRARARKFGFEPVVESFTRADVIAYWRNGERCIYCDSPATDLDHLAPVALGGHHTLANCALSCGACNNANIWHIRRTLAEARHQKNVREEQAALEQRRAAHYRAQQENQR